RRSTYQTLGGLDERIQSADWDLYYTLRKREQVVGDMKRCMVVGASFVHHFIRATIKSKREPFACTHERLTIDRKWSQAEQAELWCKPSEFFTLSVGQRLTGHVVKPIKKLFQELDRTTAWRRLWVSPDRVVDQYRRQFEQALTLLPSGVPS